MKNLPKYLFYFTCIITVLVLSFGLGLYSGAKENILYRAINSVRVMVIHTFQEAPTLAGIRPENYLQPARHEGSGVTVNEVSGNDDLILLAGFFDGNNEHRLIRRNGDIVARWPARFSEAFPDPYHLRKPPTTDWNTYIHGSVAMPDGSIVFNFEYDGLVKVDRCGKIVWKLPRETHHSLDHAEGGGFWVAGRRYYDKDTESPFPPFRTPLEEDTILKISDDGEVLAEISVPRLFYDNDLDVLLTAVGFFHAFDTGKGWNEILHLNKIEELTSDIADDFPMFDAGDLALSLRHRNMILVVDPDTGKVKWWQIGPWIRQHDPEFIAGGKMRVFNNNIYRDHLDNKDEMAVPITVPPASNIMEYNFNTGQHRIVYGSRAGQEMLSVVFGKQDATHKGGILITEPQSGRVIEVDNGGRIIWEYINRYDSDHVTGIMEARLYSQDYFKVTDWSCGE